MSFTGKNGSVCSLVLGKEKWYLLLDSPKNPRLRKGQEPLSRTINSSRSHTKCHLPQSSNSKLILPRVCCNHSRNTMCPVPSSLGKVRSPEKIIFFARFGLNSCTLQNLTKFVSNSSSWYLSQVWTFVPIFISKIPKDSITLSPRPNSYKLPIKESHKRPALSVYELQGLG